MTAVLEDSAAVPAATAPRPRGRDLLLRLLPWLVAALAAGAVLHGSKTPDKEIILYAVYFVAAVMLPGTLVLRGLYGSRGNWPEDLGLGAATGLVVLLAGWALAAATGLEWLIPAWLALVVLLFLGVPRLRRHWRIESPVPLPVAWSWGIAVVFVLVTAWAWNTYRGNPLPPVTFAHYQDMYYHLALVHEMTRSMPFQVPQVAGETLRYHYLSDADMAAASMITGISPVTVYLRLWLLPIVGTAALVVAVLARSVSGRWWAGPVAAAVAFAGGALTLGGPVTPFGGGAPISLVSPSQTYALPLLALFTLIAVEVLRGRPLGWTWAALPVLAVACAGAKSSALPPLFAGVGLAGLVLLVKRRRLPWAAIGLLGAILFGVVVGLKAFAGGGAGTLQPQPLALLRWMSPYDQTLGTADPVTAGGFLPPGVANADTAGRLFVAFIVLWWVLMQTPRLIGLVLPLRRREPAEGEPQTSDDVSYWLLGGVVVAGTAAAWLFWHPSASQGYFLSGVIPIAAVLTTCALADRAERLRVVIAAVAAGALAAVVAPRTGPPAEHTIAAWTWALAEPLLITLAIIALVAVIALVVWRAAAWRALPVGLLAAVIGASLGTGVLNSARQLDDPRPKVNKNMAVTREEMTAALWLDDNAGPDDLVATNVHCAPLNAKKLCNSRAFWVAGLGGRRTLVESWAYSDSAVAANGVNGLYYPFQPAPDPAVFDLNQRAFAQGDPADVQKLHDEYDVRWLFADSRAGAVSPALAQVADLRHTDGHGEHLPAAVTFI